MTRTRLFANQQPGGVLTIQGMDENPNNVLFVNSAHVAAENALGGGQNPDKPFATLAYVLTNAATLTPPLTAGDVIYLHPDHAETIASAGAIACSTAGVKIEGLGWGSARPTFTFSATASTWTVAGAGVSIKNIRFTSGVAELVNMITVSGADVTLDAIDFVDAGATFTTIQFLLTTTTADRMILKNCSHWKGTAAAATEEWIELIGIDGATVENMILNLTLRNHADAVTLSTTGTACLGLTLRNLVCYQAGGTTQDEVIKIGTGTTGIYADNRTFGNVGTLAASIALASMAASNSFQATTVNKSGILDPVVA